MGRTIDFTGVGEYKPAPAGTYTVEFVKFSFEQTKNGKNAGAEYIKGQGSIVDETAENGEPVQGKAIWFNWSLLPQALWRFNQDATAFGVDLSQFQTTDENGKVTLDIERAVEAMVGRKANVTVSVEEYKYPEGHAKFGTSRWSNPVQNIEEAELPEVLAPASRRRAG